MAALTLNGLRGYFADDFAKTLACRVRSCWIDTDPLEAEGRVSPHRGMRVLEEGMEIADADRVDCALTTVADRMDDCSALYALLDYDQSKDVLLTILAYRTLGWRYVKMPLDTPDFRALVHKLRRKVENAPSDQRIRTTDGYTTLSLLSLDATDLSKVKLYADDGVIGGVFHSQYEYRTRDGVL